MNLIDGPSALRRPVSTALLTGALCATLAACGGEGEEIRESDDSTRVGSSQEGEPQTNARPGVREVSEFIVRPTDSTGKEVSGGSIAGRVVYEGALPDLPDYEIPANDDVCTGAGRSDRFEVGEGGGVRNAVILLRKEGFSMKLKDPKLSGSLDQQGCRYLPHVLVVPVGGTVAITNSDPTPHNVRIEEQVTEKILMNRTQPGQGAKDEFTVPGPGVYPVECDYHPWMNSYIVGADNPWFALSAADGSFTIENISPGTYTAHLWLNGAVPKPRRDGSGKLIGYGYSDPVELESTVTIESGKATELGFRITADDLAGKKK